MSSHLDISIAIMFVILLDILALISLGLFSAVGLCFPHVGCDFCLTMSLIFGFYY